MPQLRRDPLPLPTPGLVTDAAQAWRQNSQTAPIQFSASPTTPLSAPENLNMGLDIAVTAPSQATGSAPAQIGLFDPPAKSPSAQALKNLEATLNQRLSLKGNTLPAPLRQQLQQSFDQLKQQLAFYDLSQPAVRQEVYHRLKALAQQLNMADLMELPIKAGLDQLTAGVIAESGSHLGLRVEHRGNIPGLYQIHPVEPGNETLLTESKALLQDIERAKHSPKKLDTQTLLLFGLRDELMRRNLEILASKDSETPLFVDHPETDLGVIKGMVEAVDGLLASSRDLPPDLLNDLSRLTETISTAAPGQVAENLRKLSERTTSPLNGRNNLNLPGLQTGSSQVADQLGPQMQSAASQLTDLAEQGQEISLPTPLTQLVDLAFRGIQAGPPNLGGGLSSVVDLYSRGMNSVESKLPPLWFPVTMPVPLIYNQGGDAFVLPAGSRLSQDRRTGAYTIQAPGMVLQTGDTQVTANQATVQLGNGLDRLQMASLAVNEPGQQTLLQGVTAQINRTERSSLIQAQHVTINNDAGQIQLDNARMIQTPEAFELATDRLLYQQGENTLSGQNIGLWQSEKNGIEDFRGGVENLHFNNGQTLITADRMGFQMSNNENTGAGLLRFSGENVAVQSGDSRMQAAQGSFNLFNRADGTSGVLLTAENAAWQKGNQSVTSQGLSTIQLERDAEGRIREFSAQAQSVNYANGNQIGQVTDGHLAVKYNPNGSLSQVGAQVGYLDWQDPDQGLKASGLGLNLNYDVNGQIQDLQGRVEHLSYQGQGQNLTANQSQVQARWGENGQLSSVAAEAGQLEWNGAHSAQFKATETKLNAQFHPNGQLGQVNASSGQVYLQQAGQTLQIDEAQAGVTYRPDGTLQEIQGGAAHLAWQSGSDALKVNQLQGQLNYGENGLLQSVHTQAGNISYTGNLGQVNTQGQTTLKVLYRENGELASLQTHSGQIDVVTQGLTAHAENTTLKLDTHENGLLSQISGSTDNLRLQGDWGTLNTTGTTSVGLKYTDAGQLSGVSAHSDQLSLLQNKSRLDLSGAELNAQYGADGRLENIRFTGNSVDFNGSTGQNQPLNFSMGNFAADLTQTANGGQSFQFNGQQIQLDAQGHRLNLPEVRTLNLETGGDGSISAMNLHLPGHNTYSNPDLNAALDNLQASYTQQGNELKASFEKLNLAVPKEGLTAEVLGGKLVDNDRLTSLHLDSATVVKNLEQELNVKVENVDLLINKTPTGSLASADLQIGKADALVSGMNLMVRTQNGDRVRLNVQMSDDGTFLREAFLQIPQGGEIKLSKDDLNLSLGGGQKLIFSQDGQGLYTFRGEGLNVNAVTKDAKVQVQGGTAQVSLDSKNGNLIIDEIKGVKVHAEVGGQKIDVNIKEMEGFLVRATGISGLAQGAAIHLVPTSDNSRMTAEIHTSYNGIPIAVKLENVHELKALATIETNRAHVYFGDPSGRGKVSLSAGPLEMKGSAIEFVARYQQYDPQRMMSTLSRALSSDGFEIVKGVQVELDGVLRLQTPFKNGPHVGMTLLFPRPMNMTQQPFDPNPFSASQVGKGLNDGATGIVTELGWKHTNAAGTQNTYALHAGLVPGSYLSIDQTQGQTTLAGVPLPKNFSLPTTAIAGVTFRSHGEKSRLDVMAGGYVNPAGLAPATVPLSEPNKYGAYAGFNYREGNWLLGVTSTVDLSRSKPNVGGMVTLGFSF